MYRVCDMDGEFITKIIISNLDDEELYYTEIYNYDCDVLETCYVEFDTYPTREMVLKGIEECLDGLTDNFISWHIFNMNDLTLYDIETGENVSVSKEDREFLQFSPIPEHFIELGEYEVVEENL